MASILNHSAHTDLQNPGLQNHEAKPATGTGSQAEEGTPGQNSTLDPENTPIQEALVANVGHLVPICFLIMTASFRCLFSYRLTGNRVVGLVSGAHERQVSCSLLNKYIT